MSADQAIKAYLEGHTDQLLDQLAQWVPIPSVAGVPQRAQHLVRSAHWLAGQLRDVGFPTTRIWEGAEGPAVYGSWCPVPGAPTVLIYRHHDVRAVKEENWDQTSPFDPATGGSTAAAPRMPRAR